MQRLLYGLPLVVLLAVLTWVSASLLQGGSHHRLSSTLINKPAPDFLLPPLPGHKEGLSRSNLSSRVVLVNFFASWCVPCLTEHPVLTRLSQEHGVPVLGIGFNDQPAAIQNWLQLNGDPFESIGIDSDGHTAITWGITGIPETFVVDQDGFIRFHLQGPLTPQLVNSTLLPLVMELQKR
jgi:cytochrome c biogenesis protein CcmG/thiol:disulfide interchange protein DsbE